MPIAEMIFQVDPRLKAATLPGGSSSQQLAKVGLTGGRLEVWTLP